MCFCFLPCSASNCTSVFHEHQPSVKVYRMIQVFIFRGRGHHYIGFTCSTGESVVIHSSFPFCSLPSHLNTLHVQPLQLAFTLNCCQRQLKPKWRDRHNNSPIQLLTSPYWLPFCSHGIIFHTMPETKWVLVLHFQKGSQMLVKGMSVNPYC